MWGKLGDKDDEKEVFAQTTDKCTFRYEQLKFKQADDRDWDEETNDNRGTVMRFVMTILIVMMIILIVMMILMMMMMR